MIRALSHSGEMAQYDCWFKVDDCGQNPEIVDKNELSVLTKGYESTVSDVPATQSTNAGQICGWEITAKHGVAILPAQSPIGEDSQREDGTRRSRRVRSEADTHSHHSCQSHYYVPSGGHSICCAHRLLFDYFMMLLRMLLLCSTASTSCRGRGSNGAGVEAMDDLGPTGAAGSIEANFPSTPKAGQGAETS